MMSGHLVSRTGVRFEVTGGSALSVESSSTQRREGKPLSLEEGLANICSLSAEHRTAREVSWLALQLQRIPAFQQTPEWKLEMLGRNMGVMLVYDGDDAALLCDDPATSYFVVTGSLLPTAIINRASSPSAASLESEGQPQLLGAEAAHIAARATRQASCDQPRSTDALRQEMETNHPLEHRPLVCDGGKAGLVSPTHSSLSISTDDESSFADTHPFQTNESGEEEIVSALGIPSKGVFGCRAADSDTDASLSAQEGRTGPPLLPGHSLDLFVQASVNGAVGVKGEDDSAKRPASPVSEGFDKVGRTSYRLGAPQITCIGAVSHKLLRELEREESRREIRHKIALLRRTEVFGEGFSVLALQQLAVLIERRERREAGVVLRKGSTVDQVVLIDSGEAVRLGDEVADSMKTGSSLRIKSGQMFGAEEAMSGLPSYASNLMAVTSLRFFAIPVAAFLQALDGVWTEALYRLNSRARVEKHRRRVYSERQQRPSTAAGVDGERSIRGNCPSGMRGKLLLSTLVPSETAQPPVVLKAAPSFSTEAARGYKRITGTSTQSDLDERMSGMAAVWTPWSWSCLPTDQHPPSPWRPRSAPAPCGGRSAIPSQARCRSKRSATGSTPPSRKLRAEEQRSGSEVWRCENSGSIAFGAKKHATVRGGGEMSASPEFRRLGPWDSCVTPLTGCEAATLNVVVDREFPTSDDSCCGSAFRPEILTSGVRSPRGRRPRQKLPTGPSASDQRRRRASKDGGVQSVGSKTSIPRKEPSPRTSGGVRFARDVTGGNILSTASAPLLMPSSSLLGGTSIAETLSVWSKRELAEAERAVSARPQRRRLCRSFKRSRESSPSAMTAAQRAHRGAYVMSKMGDARARLAWRP